MGAGLLMLAVLAGGNGVDVPLPEPPQDIVDFLGRRAECLMLRDGWGGAVPPQGDQDHEAWRRYECEGITEEEAVLRRRHGGDPTYIAALDRNPRRFQPGMITVTSYEFGGPLIEAMELRAVDPQRQRQIRLAFDKHAAGSRATRVSAFIDGVHVGDVMLDNRRFEDIDLQTAISYFTSSGGIGVSLRYGFPRPWCFENDDGRPMVDLVFEDDGRVSASQRLFVNCRGNSEDISPEHLR
jgi:hypothetical protein